MLLALNFHQQFAGDRLNSTAHLLNHPRRKRFVDEPSQSQMIRFVLGQHVLRERLGELRDPGFLDGFEFGSHVRRVLYEAFVFQDSDNIIVTRDQPDRSLVG